MDDINLDNNSGTKPGENPIEEREPIEPIELEPHTEPDKVSDETTQEDKGTGEKTQNLGTAQSIPATTVSRLHSQSIDPTSFSQPNSPEPPFQLTELSKSRSQPQSPNNSYNKINVPPATSNSTSTTPKKEGGYNFGKLMTSGYYNMKKRYFVSMGKELPAGVLLEDPELDEKLFLLDEIKSQYEAVLTAYKKHVRAFNKVSSSQNSLANFFMEEGIREQSIGGSSLHNMGETLSRIHKIHETTGPILKQIESSMNTFMNHAIADTIVTATKAKEIKGTLENCRLKVKEREPFCETHQKSFESALASLNRAQLRYDEVKESLAVKVEFLNSQRMKVMQRDLDSYNQCLIEHFREVEVLIREAIKSHEEAVASQPSPDEVLSSILEQRATQNMGVQV